MCPECKADLVPVASGWVCPNWHGRIMPRGTWGLVRDAEWRERLRQASCTYRTGEQIGAEIAKANNTGEGR